MPTTPIVDVWIGSIAADNHEPTRNFYQITGEVYAPMPGTWERCVVITTTDDITDMIRSNYLLDDGATVVPHYVGGWNQTFTRVFLYPFPVNPDQRRRTDNGQVIDYSTFALGPRRCYHVKIRRTS
jgi:hypothetical protein